MLPLDPSNVGVAGIGSVSFTLQVTQIEKRQYCIEDDNYELHRLEFRDINDRALFYANAGGACVNMTLPIGTYRVSVVHETPGMVDTSADLLFSRIDRASGETPRFVLAANACPRCELLGLQMPILPAKTERTRGLIGDFSDATLATTGCEPSELCMLSGNFAGTTVSGLAWRWRLEGSFDRADLTGVSIQPGTDSEATLLGSFVGAALSEAFEPSALRLEQGVRMDGAMATRLRQAERRGSQVYGTARIRPNGMTTFQDADLDFSWMELDDDISHVGLVFQNCSLENFPIRRKTRALVLEDPTFSGCRIRGGELWVHFSKPSPQAFHGAQLRQLTLQSEGGGPAILDDTGFDAAELDQVVFSPGSSLIRMSMLGAHWHQVDARQTVLSSAHLTQSHILSSLFSFADLTGADLTDAELVAVNANNADFSASKLVRTHADGLKVQGALLNNADATNAIMAMSDACGADLTGMNGRGARFPEMRVVDDSCAAPTGLELIATDQDTVCPDDSTGPCQAAQWRAMSPPSSACCNPALAPCPVTKRDGATCDSHCECFHRKCLNHTCQPVVP